jgi:phosphoglucosamine mutase
MVKTFPQKLKNIRVKEKPPLEKLEKLQNAIKEAEEKLAGKGRVLVRYSGTEPLLRIMVEAEDESLIDLIIETLEKAVKEEGIAL